MMVEEFIKKIDKHLSEKKGNVIAVTSGNRKLAKDSNIDKFNFTSDDIIADSGSIGAFLKSLPNRGFGNGKMVFRVTNGTTKKSIAEADLTAPVKESNTTNTPSMPNNNNAPHQPQQAAMAQPMPQAAMGYTQVPQTDWIGLKVKEERYADVLDKLRRAEKERDEAQSAKRIAQEENATLERKLDTIEDKYEWKIEKLEKSQKKFWDTETGKETIQGALGMVPTLMAQIANKGKSPQLAMGTPQMSPQRQQFFTAMQNVPDELLQLVLDTAAHIVENEEFRLELQAMFYGEQPKDEPITNTTENGEDNND